MTRVHFICDVCNFAVNHVIVGSFDWEWPKLPLKYINGYDVCRNCESKIEFEVREVEKATA